MQQLCKTLGVKLIVMKAVAHNVDKNLIRKLLNEVIGTTKLVYQGNEIDFGKETWERINYAEEMKKVLGFDYLDIEDVNEFKQKVVEKGLFTFDDLEECKCVRTLIDFIYKRKIRVNGGRIKNIITPKRC